MKDSVLLITVDCLRADHVHAYGYDRETTPNIDTIANTGTLYENAFSNGPGTRFAFKGINAGVYPLRISGVGLPRTADQTVAEALSSAGYRTAGFANNPFLTTYFNHHRGFETFLEVPDWEQGQDAGTLGTVNSIARKVHQRLSGGNVHKYLKKGYERFLTVAESRGTSVGIEDELVIDRAITYIQEQGHNNEPYFAWVHLMDVHGPHQYRSDARETLGIETEHIRSPGEYILKGEETPQAVIDTYDASLRHVDEQIGRLLEAVDSDTTVVLTADHGEEFGRHNDFHAPSTYQSMAHVPLIVDGEQFNTDRQTKPVSHVDLAATIVDIAKAGPDGQWDGKSLLLDYEEPSTQFLGFENEEGVFGAVIDYPYKYMLATPDIESEPTTQSLFKLDEDVHEMNDRSSDVPKIFESLDELWEDHISDISSSRLEAEHDIWDPSEDLREEIQNQPNQAERDIEEQLEHLGYK